MVVVTAVENVWTLEPGFWKLEGWMSVISFVEGLILQWFINPFGQPGAELVLRLFFFKVSVWLIFSFLLLSLFFSSCLCVYCACVLCFVLVRFMSHFSQSARCFVVVAWALPMLLSLGGLSSTDCCSWCFCCCECGFLSQPRERARVAGREGKQRQGRLIANDKQGKSTGFLSAGKEVITFGVVSLSAR